jgi:hypothetical protein
MTSSAFGLVAATLVASMMPAAAQDQNQVSNPLSAVCTGVLAQSNINVGDADRLCACLIRQTPAHLTPQEMEIYAEASQAGKQPPQPVMDKVIAVATECLQEAQ